MTEEKKDNVNEQQTFLNGHEELLKSISEKKEAAAEQPENPEPAEETPTAEAVAEEEPVAEKEPALATDPEPVVETPIVKPQPRTLNSTGKKKKTTPQHSPQHEDLLKQQALEQREVKEVLAFFQKYAKPAVIAVAVICAVVLVDKFLKTQRYKKEATADTALMHAQNAEDLQAIIDDYASTPAGPLALMGLAREKFNAGQFNEAEVLYAQFTKKYGGHELAAQAELNLVTCKEAKGQFGDAHLLYGKFEKKHTGSYLLPSAMMGKARCLEALGQLDEAQIAYEDIIINFPEGSWARIAEASLKMVLSKKQ